MLPKRREAVPLHEIQRPERLEDTRARLLDFGLHRVSAGGRGPARKGEDQIIEFIGLRLREHLPDLASGLCGPLGVLSGAHDEIVIAVLDDEAVDWSTLPVDLDAPNTCEAARLVPGAGDRCARRAHLKPPAVGKLDPSELRLTTGPLDETDRNGSHFRPKRFSWPWGTRELPSGRTCALMSIPA